MYLWYINVVAGDCSNRVNWKQATRINGETNMPMREKDRNLRRRRRRVLKLRRLKKLLVEAKDLKTRQKLITKIHKLDPWHEIPDAG